MCSVFPAPSQTFTFKETQYQRMARTQFHEPINTAFALITIFSSLGKHDESYQEDVHYCQASFDGNGNLACHQVKISKWKLAITCGNRSGCPQIVSQCFISNTGLQVKLLSAALFTDCLAQKDVSISSSSLATLFNPLLVKTILCDPVSWAIIGQSRQGIHLAQAGSVRASLLYLIVRSGDWFLLELSWVHEFDYRRH